MLIVAALTGTYVRPTITKLSNLSLSQCRLESLSFVTVGLKGGLRFAALHLRNKQSRCTTFSKETLRKMS